MRDPEGNTGARPRVFVTSVIEGFAEFRQTAREAIASAGGEPLLVNEDFPSLATSSRNACLDAVDSADYFVSVVGTRGGWTTPSGKLVVEEEYDRATAGKLPVLVLLQEGERDAEGTRFARRLSDYVDGTVSRTFSTPEELRRELERALRPLLAATPVTTTMPRPARDYFTSPEKLRDASTLRTVLTPEREEEVFDPVRLDSAEFLRRVYEIGHSAAVGLFSYERRKVAVVEGDSLVVRQTASDGRHGEGERVRLQLTETGEVVIDANVTGRVKRGRGARHARRDGRGARGHRDRARPLPPVHRGALRRRRPLQATPALPLQRCAERLVGYRTLTRNPQPQLSYGMSMRHRDTILVFDAPRVNSRAELNSPRKEIERVLTLLRRKASA